MRVIFINPFERRLHAFDLPPIAANLIPGGLGAFAFWLNDSDALYAVEQLVVQQYFSFNGNLVFGVGMIVGLDRTGCILEAPTMSKEEIAKAVNYGSADTPFRKYEGYHPWEE
jgi:hypothetical protein